MKNALKLFAVIAALSLSNLGYSDSTANANPGQQVTFTVANSGTAPFTYQWAKNGVNIIGANSVSYVINAVSLGDVGTYTVRVSNAAGNTLSDNAMVTVTAAPGSAIITITVK